METEQFKCKTCGGMLNDLVKQSTDGTVVCPFCSNVWTIPKGENPLALSFLRMGEHDLDTCRFDDAYEAYKKVVEIDKDEPEAYFGLALAKFKVQYLKDEVNHCLQPISHELSDKKFSDDPDFIKACQKATASQKAEYERRAQDIDFIQSEFVRLEKSGLNYDSFICVKVSGSNGNTEDSKDAEYIYHLLKENNFNPFYSEYEIRNKQGTSYEAHILYALYKSECMLVVCRDESYLQTPWVKNEYTRFLKLVNDEEKESDAITIVFSGTPVERLPGKNGKIQGIDFSQRVSDRQIINFVYNHTPEARKKRAEEAEQKKRDEAEREKRWQEQLERQQQAQKKEFEEKLKKVALVNNPELSVQQNLLSRAWQEVVSKDYNNALNYFNAVLDKNAECAEAWRGILCTTFCVQDIEEILDSIEPKMYYSKIIEAKGFSHWAEYSIEDEEEKEVFEHFITEMKERLENSRADNAAALADEREKLERFSESTDARVASIRREKDEAAAEFSKEQSCLVGKKSNFKYHKLILKTSTTRKIFALFSLLFGALWGYLIFKNYFDGKWSELPYILKWGTIIGNRWGLLVVMLVNSLVSALILLLVLNIFNFIIAKIHNHKEQEREEYYVEHDTKRSLCKQTIDILDGQLASLARDGEEFEANTQRKISVYSHNIDELDKSLNFIEEL